jgi:hypothetical protein
MTESQDERRGEVCAGPAQLNRELLDERLGLPSASSWRRYELCAGSYQLELEARKLGQVAHVSSPDAERGELIHAWLAGIPDEDGKEIKLNDSEAQTAEFLLERMSDQRVRIFGEEPTQQLVEKRLWLTLNGKRVLSGRFDRVIYTDTLALLQDAKTGWAEPDPAEQNAQLKVLAVLVALHMPPTLKEVIVQIVSGPYGVTEARYDRPHLKEAWDSIVRTLRSLYAPDAPLNPSPEACRFCGAINVCTAVKKLANPIAILQISALPGGVEGSQILDKVEVLQEHLDAIREYYEAQLTKDPAYQLPGYAMVPGNEVRTVKDWKTAKIRLAEFLPDDQIEKAGSFAITKIQSALAKELKLTPDLAEAKFNQILDGLIELKQNKSSLKRVSRPKLVVVTLP